MAGLRDIFNRALKPKRSSAYLFVSPNTDTDPIDQESHLGALQDHHELLERSPAPKDTTGTRRPLVRSSTQATLDNLQLGSKFTKREVNELYREFKHECPAGYITKEQFQSLYRKCFPLGGSGRYAGYVFNTLEQDKDGHVSFRAFLSGMSVLSRGTTEEKLQWIFTLYDIDKNGYITKNEMVEIVSAVYEMRSEAMPGQPVKVDTDAVINHATNVFCKMDANKDGLVSYEEFIEACHNDEDIRKTIGTLNGGLHLRRHCFAASKPRS
ncbi:Kv channel-interacting protein 4-like [Paramacrobiotus metropolitanus]|uniref:Kv channel-interacting protein 4-like n=1 Tax=Paramacrobiotus metropolitanus TaxID=2943436 RepID=UPI00244580D8|nr:Kv channel-interacting protein 4-like [Paramacrobiotus metropolitanus]